VTRADQPTEVEEKGRVSRGGVWYAWKRMAEHRPAESAAGATPSIAVLPFTDMSPSRDLEYFVDGIAEEILNSLAQVQGLKVIGRTASFSFKGKSEDLRAIGQKLNAEAILEGSVRKDGPNLRITAQLIRASDGVHLWAHRFDSAQGGVFALQDEIARAVAGALRVKLLPGQDLETRWIQTDKPEAYQALLLGRSFIRRDTLGDYRRALAAVEKAVVLAPDVPQAYRARSEVRWTFENDSTGADADRARASALLAREAAARGTDTREVAPKEGPEARVARGRANVDRDPLDPQAWSRLGAAYILADDLVHAREALARSLELSPGNSDAVVLLAGCLAAQGRYDEFLTLANGTELRPFAFTFRAIALRGLARVRESQEAVDTLIERWTGGADYQIAEVYAWWGETDRAFGWLERADADRDAGLSFMRVDPLLRSLRTDPRWKPLIEKVFR